MLKSTECTVRKFRGGKHALWHADNAIKDLQKAYRIVKKRLEEETAHLLR
jgi:hypothetical protein